MKYLMHLALMVLLTACESKDCCGPVPSEWTPLTHLVFAVKDSMGADRLNPKHERPVNVRDIRLEKVTAGGNEILSYDPRSTNIQILEHPSIPQLHVLMLASNLKLDASRSSESIIHWNTKDSDTLKVTFNEYASEITRVLLNGDLLWHNLSGSSLPPTIIRNE